MITDCASLQPATSREEALATPIFLNPDIRARGGTPLRGMTVPEKLMIAHGVVRLGFFFFFWSKFLLWQLVPRDNENVEKVLLLGSRHRVLLQRRFAEYQGRRAEAMNGSTAMAHELQRRRAETLRTT